MATFTANSNGIYAKLVVTEQSQSVANNTTTLLWEIYMWNTTAKPNWYMYDQHNIFQVKINGEYVLNNSDFGRVSLQYEQPESAARLITSGTYTIAHNSDGTKTGVPVYLYAAQGWEYAYVWETSGTMNLTTIARASQPSLSASSITLGSAVTIYTNRASSSFTHTLEYSIGSASGPIASDVGDKYDSWPPSKELARQFPNATSGVVTITCKTYNGSTLIGTKQTFLTINISSDMIPSVSATISEAASIPSGISGYIKTRSKLRIVASASGLYGATIMSYKITANGATYNASEATTGYLTTAGSNTITVTVTDSRGQSKTYSTTVTVLDYSPPRIDSLNAYRCNSSGTADAEGAYLKIEFTGTITSLNSKNSRTAYVQTRPSGGSWSTQGYTLGSGYSGFTGYTAVLSAATTTSYEVRVQVADSFSTSSFYTTTVSTASILMNILADKSGMAIGKMAEKAKTVQLGWDLEVFDQPANTVLAAPNGADGVAKFRKLIVNDIHFQYGNEINFGGNADVTGIYFNYRNTSTGVASGNTPTRAYYFGNKNGGTGGVTLYADAFAGRANTTNKVIDSGDGRELTLNYSAEGISNPTWLAAWNGNELRGVAPANTGLVPTRKNNHTYTNVDSDYSGGSTPTYWRIALPDISVSYWNMVTIEVTVRQYYDAGTGGKIIINVYHAPGGNWTGFSAFTFGYLSMESIGVYGSDGKYLYISGCGVYSTISLDKMLIGDVAVSLDLSSTTIDLVTSLPSTYQSAAMIRGDSITGSSIYSGTSGIWNYIKYNSGIAMCWGQTAICNTAFTATWGNWYIHDYLFPAQRFPFDFVEIPKVFASQGKHGTTACEWSWYSGGEVTTQYTPRYSVFRPTTTGATVNLSLNLFAIGRWK